MLFEGINVGYVGVEGMKTHLFLRLDNFLVKSNEQNCQISNSLYSKSLKKPRIKQ